VGVPDPALNVLGIQGLLRFSALFDCQMPRHQLIGECPTSAEIAFFPVWLNHRYPTLTGVQVQVDGLPGKDYILQASTNLKNWTALQTNIAVPDPSVVLPTNLTFFVDLTAANLPSRFYRVLQQP